MYMYTFWCMYLYVYMCMCMYMCMYMYAYVYVYVYDISTVLWLMFLTCIFSNFIWLVDFRYCMFLFLPFYSLMFFYTPLNVAFILIICTFALYHMSVHCQKWREKKDVQLVVFDNAKSTLSSRFNKLNHFRRQTVEHSEEAPRRQTTMM